MQLVVELYSLSDAVDNNKTYESFSEKSVSQNHHKRQFHQTEKYKHCVLAS